MTDLDLDRIEALADAATPGPWFNNGPDTPGEFVVYDGEWSIAEVSTYGPEASRLTAFKNPSYIDPNANAAFIAGTGPDVVKELVRQLREARAGIAEAWEAGYLQGTADHCKHGDTAWAYTNPYRSGDERIEP